MSSDLHKLIPIMSAGGERGGIALLERPQGPEDRRALYASTLHLGTIAHFYQPLREPRTWSALGSERREAVLPEVNEGIHQECYAKVLASPDGIPAGMVFSLYGPLRDWMRANRPGDFAQVQRNVAALGDRAQWQVLGDPYFHGIMPLKSAANQDMLIKVGIAAYKADFGFEPKGIWLPETAVSNTTLEVLANNGIKFVVLRDTQVEGMDTNIAYADLGRNDLKIAVVKFDSDLSGRVSFDDWMTFNADGFLQGRNREGRHVNIATDGELYGHHKKGREEFLRRMVDPDVQLQYGIQPFDPELELEMLAELPKSVRVYDKTSWSCLNGHELGRWTGDIRCGCDGVPDRDSRSMKRQLYQSLTDYGDEIDRRLDLVDSNWRDRFIPFFFAVRDGMYGHSDVWSHISALASEPEFEYLNNRKVLALFLAALSVRTGLTSCFNFFGGRDRPERQIARVNIRDIKRLVPDIDRARGLVS